MNIKYKLPQFILGMMDSSGLLGLLFILVLPFIIPISICKKIKRNFI